MVFDVFDGGSVPDTEDAENTVILAGHSVISEDEAVTLSTGCNRPVCAKTRLERAVCEGHLTTK